MAGFKDADRQFAMGQRLAMGALAQAFDLGGKPDSAIARFEQLLSIPDPSPFVDEVFRAAALKRLGELYEAKGDTTKAESNYQKFVELWKDADPAECP